ncbi:MAG: hypothetical protein E7167_02795 [Firmicutes bacterium]|nr:hypothetical protein [Bacillota bacterium]
MQEVQELYKKMSEFEYGWIDKTGYKYVNKIAKNKFITDYYLQKPKDLEKNKIGICWDQVEYERSFFEKNGISFKTIFIIYDDGVKYPNHTFLIFKENQKYYWFENTYADVKGILEFDSLQECLSKVKKEFMKETHLEEIGDRLYYYVYDKPKYGIGALDFITHCQNGIKADLDLKNIDIW